MPADQTVITPRNKRYLGLWLSQIRVHQWPKNLLVFVAIFAAQRLTSLEAWEQVSLTFIGFCLVCSAMYIVNDLVDVEADRMHAVKQRRPIAAGEISRKWAVIVAIAIATTGLFLGSIAGIAVFLVLVAYCIASATYTYALKRVAIIDVFWLAGLYSWRVLAGAIAASLAISPWLVAFSLFVFLSLALLKRHVEVGEYAAADAIPGRGYCGGDQTFLLVFGIGTGLAATVVLALYVGSATVAAAYHQPAWLWAWPTLVLFVLARIWFRGNRGLVDDDPLRFVMRDSMSWLAAGLVAMTYCLAAV